MESTTSERLDEYRRSDLTKRLHLYLQYPELRAEFTEMDRGALHPGARDCGRGSECRARITGGDIFRPKPGCVRRLFGWAQGRT